MLFLYNLIVFHIPTLLAHVAVAAPFFGRNNYYNTQKVLQVANEYMKNGFTFSSFFTHFPIVLFFCVCTFSLFFMDDGGTSSVLQSYKLATKLPQTFIIISFYCICEILFYYLILFSFLLHLLRSCHLQPK
jgi:hypothetical protein